EHIRIGRKYPDIKLNTTYSYGIDDQEFVVAFEGDNPHDFVDLVQELRLTEASMYTLQDTPMHICLAKPLPEMLDTLGGQPIAHLVEEDVTELGGWLQVARVEDLPLGETRLVYYGREQIGLFNIEGTIYALNNRCPHARGPLHEGEVSCPAGADPQVRCPWHEAYFSLESGQVLGGPSPRGVETFQVKTEDGYIHIARRETIEETMPAR
ncbi:MAG: Rieske 2Fe-2S domain-containing protein, partial [Chloroflexi bacterium]|nr:Rieske 2Fe-2S domain-containing protein [Chloroflexota bacterium]